MNPKIIKIILFLQSLTEEQFHRILENTDQECKRCGNCCKRFAIAEIGKKKGEICKYLENNNCSIYENRPEACRNFPHIWNMHSNKKFLLYIMNKDAEECHIIKSFLSSVQKEMKNIESGNVPV